MQYLSLSAIVVLLPILPALILYRALPSNTVVRGPFKGLTVHLTGAFGGYFLLVLVMTSLVVYLHEGETRYQVWKVEGRVGFTDGGQGRKPSAVTISVVPPNLQPQDDGTFKGYILATPDHMGQYERPSLRVTHDECDTLTVHLDKQPLLVQDYSPEIDEQARTIKIQKRVEFENCPVPAPAARVSISR